MQLLPTSTSGSYQLPSSHVQIYHFDERDLTFTYCEETKQYHLFRRNAAVLETNILPEDSSMVYPMPPCGFVLVTSDNSLYLCNLPFKSPSSDDVSRHISKKIKLSVGSNGHYEKLFQANGTVDWVQHVATTLYASSVASNCIHIYDFSSAKHETVPIPQQLCRSLPTCFSKVDFGDDQMSDLDPIFADHFGINCLHGILIGFGNGSICFIPHRDISKGTYMIAQLQFETIMGMHSCQLGDGNNQGTPTGKNLLIFVGSKGTIHVYSKCVQQQSHQVIQFKEFTLPTAIISISFIKDSPSALVFCKTGLMYQVEFSRSATSNRQEAPPEIVMELTQLQAPEDIICVQAIKKHHSKLTYQTIRTDGNFSTCEVDLGSSPITITRTMDTMKNAINDTLAELAEMESSQAEMDAYHEGINLQLVTLNRTLYTLQNASFKKKRNHNTDDFNLDLVSMIRYTPITGQPQAFLQIRLRTTLNLNWTDWNLIIDVTTQRTTKQESDSYALEKSDYVFGKTFLLPLDGFEHDHNDSGIVQTWERDLALDQINCPFPIDIYVSLSMNMDTNVGITNDSLVPEFLPITDNASNGCTNFLVTFMVVDHLHFAMPLSDSRKKQLKQNGLKDVTAQLHHRWKRPISRNMLGMGSADLQHSILNYGTSNIRLRFVAPANADKLYQTVLSTLLSEGKSSDELGRLIDDAEHAFLLLVSDPEFPVAITLSKVSLEPDQDLYLNIRLSCLSTHVLVKIELSLLSRLQPFVTDDDGDNADAKLDSSTYYQTYQLLENYLASLERCYQQSSGKESDVWQKLKHAWNTTRQLQNDTWLCIHDFSI